MYEKNNEARQRFLFGLGLISRQQLNRLNAMHNNIFSKKFIGDAGYQHGWSVALENFNQIQTEEGKKKKWKHQIRDWWKKL